MTKPSAGGHNQSITPLCPDALGSGSAQPSRWSTLPTGIGPFSLPRYTSPSCSPSERQQPGQPEEHSLLYKQKPVFSLVLKCGVVGGLGWGEGFGDRKTQALRGHRNSVGGCCAPRHPRDQNSPSCSAEGRPQSGQSNELDPEGCHPWRTLGDCGEPQHPKLWALCVCGDVCDHQ